MRQLIADYDLPCRRLPGTSLGELARETERAGQLRLNSRYAALGELLPGLVEDLISAAYHSRGLVLLESAADRIATKVVTDRRAAAVYGALHARAGVLAALGGDARIAWSNLRTAKMMAEAVDGDVEYFHTSFGPSSLKVHEVAAAVELRDGVQAVDRASVWRPPVGLPAERASHFFIDLARAQVWTGDPAGAVASLLEARRRAPLHTRTNPGSREVVSAVLDRSSRSADAIRGLATWLGISH